MNYILYLAVIFCCIIVSEQVQQGTSSGPENHKKRVSFEEITTVRPFDNGDAATFLPFRREEKQEYANDLIEIIKDPAVEELPESASPKSIAVVATTGERPLVTALLNRKFEMARKLVLIGADPFELSVTKNDKINALHAAVLASNSDFVNEFLERGVDVNSPTGLLQNTPLHLAALNNLETISKILIDKGANEKSTNINGKIADDLKRKESELHSRPRLQKIAGVRQIEGEDMVSATNEEYNPDDEWSQYKGDRINALHAAVVFYRTSLIPPLAKKLGVDSQTEIKRQTALHLAVNLPNFELVEILLDAGANPTIRDKDGKSPFVAAVELLPNHVEAQSDILDSMLTKKLIPPQLIATVSKTKGWKMYNRRKGLGHIAGNAIRKIRGKGYKVTPRNEMDVYADTEYW